MKKNANRMMKAQVGRNAARVQVTKRTNEFHDIRLRELKRERECLRGAPTDQVAPSYFVPSLKEICASTIADHFEQLPNVDGLRELAEDLYHLIIDQLPTDLKLTVSVPRVKAQDYWRSCCEARWSVGQLTSFAKSGKLEPPQRGGWKRVYLERNLEEMLMSLDGTQLSEEEEARLVQLCTLCGAEIYSLCLPYQKCHFDLYENLFSKLPHLEEFTLTYSVLNAAVTFKLDMVGFKQHDALAIQRVLKACPSLRSLSLPGNRIDGELVKAILAGLVKNNTLTHLDLSHNKIGDDGAAALAVILSKKDVALKTIDLSDNCIRGDGAKSLGRALGSNTSVESMSLRLNRIGDSDGASFFELLQPNASIGKLDMSNNQLGPESAKSIAEFLKGQTTIVTLTLAGNSLKEEGGKMLVDGISACNSLRFVDVRSCGISDHDVLAIEKLAQRRLQSLKIADVERQEGEMREEIQKVVAEKIRKTHGA